MKFLLVFQQKLLPGISLSTKSDVNVDFESVTNFKALTIKQFDLGNSLQAPRRNQKELKITRK